MRSLLARTFHLQLVGGRKISDRFKKFLDSWADKCRQEGKVSKKYKRETLSNDVIVSEVRSIFSHTLTSYGCML